MKHLFVFLWKAIKNIMRTSVAKPSIEKKYTPSQDMSIKDIESLYLPVSFTVDADSRIATAGTYQQGAVG
jgi:hypothetical protein